MRISDSTQAALTATKLLGSSSPSPTRDQAPAAGLNQSGPDMVAFSQRAKEVLAEIRRLAAEETALKHGQTIGSDAAVVSLRLDTSGAARLDGTVTGSARVGLYDSGSGPGRIVSLDVHTGDGNDRVSVIATGKATSYVQVYTNGGNDVIDLKGQMGGYANAGDGSDVIRAEGEVTKLVGDAGDDTFELKNVSGLISGGAGDDQINLSWDGAAATAKRHFATLPGSDGSNLEMVVKQNVAEVVFRRGGGHDVVTTATVPGERAPGVADIWMADMSASDVEAKHDGKDLVLRVKDTGDTLTLRDYDPAAWTLVRFREGERSLADFVQQAERVDTVA